MQMYHIHANILVMTRIGAHTLKQEGSNGDGGYQLPKANFLFQQYSSICEVTLKSNPTTQIYLYLCVFQCVQVYQ